jgi:hypothetical protein
MSTSNKIGNKKKQPSMKRYMAEMRWIKNARLKLARHLSDSAPKELDYPHGSGRYSRRLDCMAQFGIVTPQNWAAYRKSEQFQANRI